MNIVFFSGHQVYMFIGDPTVVQELYTTHNKLFDKHSMHKSLTYELTGKSILFAETDKIWKQRRNALRPAFYQGKLLEMVGASKECMKGTLQRWIKKSSEEGGRINMINEISLMFTRIILKCAIGESLDDVIVDYWVNGKNVKSDVP